MGIAGNTHIGQNLYVTGDILPSANITSNIGSPTKRFNTLFVSANTIDIGGATLSSTGNAELKISAGERDLIFDETVIKLLSNVSSQGGAVGPSDITFNVDGSVYATGYYYSGNGQPVGQQTGSTNIFNSNITVSAEVTEIDSFVAEGNTSVKWTLTATNPTAGHRKMSTVDSINDGSEVYYNEYGVILSNSEQEVVTFTSNIVAGNIKLWASNVNSGTQITFQRVTLGPTTATGAASVESFTAAKGYTGSIGTVGYTGSAGAGYAGSQGETGYAGSQGPTGYTGSASTSTVGFYGSAGGGAIGGNLYVPGTTTVSGNIIPTANVTYSLGTSENRFKDLYLSGNTLYLGNETFSTADILPFNLTIAPEVLTIQVDSVDPGDDVTWLWTWETSTLPYARTQITNSPQINVPLYRQGTYVVNNFAANELHGNLTQVHKGYFKWIEGAGTQNLISWAVDQGNVNVSHPSINSGNVTSVQRYTVTVPATITVPTLNTHTANYTVSFANIGSYTFTGDREGDNPTIGPLYRGGTYTFTLNSTLANHPFYLTTDNGTGFVANTYVGEYTTGVTGTRGNGQPGFNTLTFVVPNNAPSTLYYQCGVHSHMRGAIRIKDLAVDTNVNGNYVVYFQHTHEGHATPIELRPIPSLVNQMCLVYDATVGQFVPQDMATYVENTPSFKNKIQEVAGTATLIAPDGIPVVPTVSIVEDASYLPFVDNKDGDISYTEDTKTLYVWDNNTWNSTKAESSGVGYTGSAGSGYTGSAGVGLQVKTMEYDGSLVVFNGTKRWWIPSNYNIYRLVAFVSVAPTGANLNIRLNKNGSSVSTLTVPSGLTTANATVNISLVEGDYMTVDITSVGSTQPGQDLSLIVQYTS